jgi:uncharacterized OB-fold protein
MTTPAQPLPAPAPPVNPETRAFWEATQEGRLLLRRCRDCGAVIWYPRTMCPQCASLRTEWVEAAGRGHIYSYTVNHRGEGAYREAPPFVLAYVELEEGPRMMTNIVGADPAELAVGLPVQVVFHDTGDGAALPRFQPLRAGEIPSPLGTPRTSTAVPPGDPH